MAVEFTDEQKLVIQTRNKNILVSAAAGSGKTAVLTERIIKKMTEDNPKVGIDRLLIVTFTENAASEMRDRISKKLDEMIERNPKDSWLKKQKMILPIAHISTIHGFCLHLIRNHFQEIGLDPAFRIADDGEKALLVRDCLDLLMEQECKKAREEFFLCEQCFDEDGNFSVLKERILQIFRFVQSVPFPEEWFAQSMRELSSDAVIKDDGNNAEERNKEEDAYFSFLKEYENNTFAELMEGVCYCIGICDEPMGPLQYKKALQDDYALLEALLNADFEGRNRIFSTLKFTSAGRRNASMGEEDAQKKLVVTNFRDQIEKKTLKNIAQAFHLYSTEEIHKQMKENGSILYELLYLAREFYRMFEEKKRESKIIDFSDMEHMALQILLKKNEDGEYVKTPTALDYADYFDEILVDEYQDSNEVQEEILNSISKQTGSYGNRFMVGDIKQSIYRFRLARPEIFMKKYHSFDTTGQDKNIRIDLAKNFRSRAAVLDSVNKTFEMVMSKPVGGIEYDKAAWLYKGAKYPDSVMIPEEDVRIKDSLRTVSETNKDGFTDRNSSDLIYKTEVLCLDRDEVKAEGGDYLEAEALAIAFKIKEFYGKLPVAADEYHTRPATYRDMVILLRKAQGVDTCFKEVLEREGIPVYVQSRNGYFQAPEIRQILNFLSVISNPRQDIALLGTMTSFFGSFSPDEIASIRTLEGREGLLLDSVYSYAIKGKDEMLRNKIRSFLEELEDLRDLSERVTVSELITVLYQKNDYLNVVSALPAGEKRRGNLLLLKQKAESYECSGYSGISDFIRYIEDMKATEVDFGEANLLDENEDVVRIMTIHKSKGLEFPVCFVADLGRKISQKEIEKEILIDSDLGISMEEYSLSNYVKKSGFRKEIAKQKIKMDCRGEDLRILYVAMTRAKEKLILSGSVKKPDDKKAVGRKIYSTEVLAKQNFMDLLLTVVLSSPDTFDYHRIDYKSLAEEKTIEQGKQIVLKEMLLNVSSNETMKPFVYPHETYDGLYVKVSVSDIKKDSIEQDDALVVDFETERHDPIVPEFLQKKEAAGTQRGSAYHRVMELMDFSFSNLSGQDMCIALQNHRQKMIDNLMISSEDDSLVSEDKIISFLESDLSHRMALAQNENRLFCEQPFVLSLSAKLVNEEFPEEERVLVQGVIDAYFEEDGELVLLDYKTDRVDTPDELIRRYKKQMELYTQALERLENKKVKEIIFYSFYFNRPVVMKPENV